MNKSTISYPRVMKNYRGEARKIGYELEFTGLEIEQIVQLVQDHFGGEVKKTSPYEYKVANQKLGDFNIEIDAYLLKEMIIQDYLEDLGIRKGDELNIRKSIDRLLKDVAETVVPYEVISPPLNLDHIVEMEQFKDKLRQHGAKGTEDSMFYAFGMQLNLDVPSLDVTSCLNYLRAFFLIYPWLKKKLKIDFTRQLTPYVNPFPRKYIKKVLAPAYRPSMDKLIHDYLVDNPTRNRPLDLLPLFAYIDREKVESMLKDPLIKSRPAFHYRLPNSKVSLESWSIIREWNYWVKVEELVCDTKQLEKFSREYLQYLKDPLLFKRDWIIKVSQWAHQRK